jgi:hypothetical protein
MAVDLEAIVVVVCTFRLNLSDCYRVVMDSMRYSMRNMQSSTPVHNTYSERGTPPSVGQSARQ